MKTSGPKLPNSHFGCKPTTIYSHQRIPYFEYVFGMAQEETDTCSQESTESPNQQMSMQVR